MLAQWAHMCSVLLWPILGFSQDHKLVPARSWAIKAPAGASGGVGMWITLELSVSPHITLDELLAATWQRLLWLWYRPPEFGIEMVLYQHRNTTTSDIKVTIGPLFSSNTIGNVRHELISKLKNCD